MCFSKGRMVPQTVGLTEKWNNLIKTTKTTSNATKIFLFSMCHHLEPPPLACATCGLNCDLHNYLMCGFPWFPNLEREASPPEAFGISILLAFFGLFWPSSLFGVYAGIIWGTLV